jgi:hypothetical protein
MASGSVGQLRRRSHYFYEDIRSAATEDAAEKKLIVAYEGEFADVLNFSRSAAGRFRASLREA